MSRGPKNSGKRKTEGGRVAFLRREWAAKVQARLPDPTTMPIEARAARTPEGVFDILVRVDPSPKRMHLQQLLRWFDSGDFRLEDARRTRELLDRFLASKPRLPEEARDINRYRRSGDLVEVLDRLDGITVADPMAFFKVPEEVRSETRVVANGLDWLLVELLGKDASAHFASGTSWCTRHPETFKSYRNRGPLFVAIWPGGRVQFHVSKNSHGQICDERDRTPDPAVMATLPMALRASMLDCVAGALCGTGSVDAYAIDEGVEKVLRSIGGWKLPEKVWDPKLKKWQFKDGDRGFTGSAAYMVPSEAGNEVVAWGFDGDKPAFLAFSPSGGYSIVEADAYFDRPSTIGNLTAIARIGGLPPGILLRLGPDHPAFLEAMADDSVLFECMRIATARTAPGCTDGQYEASLAWLNGLDVDRVREIALGKPANIAKLLAGLPLDGALTRCIVSVSDSEAFAEALGTTIEPTLDFLKNCLTEPMHCLDGIIDVFARIIPLQAPWLSEYFDRTPHKLALTLAGLGVSPFRDRLAPILVPFAEVSDRDEGRFLAFVGSPTRVPFVRKGFDSSFEEMVSAFRRYKETDRDWAGAPASGGRVPALAGMLLCDVRSLIDEKSDDFETIASVAPPGTASVARAVHADVLAGFVRRIYIAWKFEVESALRGFRCGHVIGALEPHERTVDLFELAIDLGRGGALSVLPPDIATPDLVARLALTGEVEPMVDIECATPKLLETVLVAMSSDKAVHETLIEFADNLAIYVWLRAVNLVPDWIEPSDSVPEVFNRVASGLANGVPFDRVFLPGIQNGTIPFRSVPGTLRTAILMGRSVTSRLPEGEILALAPMANIDASPFGISEIPKEPRGGRLLGGEGLLGRALRFLGLGAGR